MNIKLQDKNSQQKVKHRLWYIYNDIYFGNSPIILSTRKVNDGQSIVLSATQQKKLIDIIEKITEKYVKELDEATIPFLKDFKI